MMVSTRSLQVYDSSLPEGTPLVYEIEGGTLRGPIRGVVRIGEPAEYDVPPGVYEVSVVHPRLGRLSKVLNVGEEMEPVLFRDMKRHAAQATGRKSLWLSWWRATDRRLPVIVWRDRVLDFGEGDGRIACPAPDVEAVTVSDGKASVATRLPPGTRFLEIQTTRAGRPTLRPRTDNLTAESMLDYAVEGYPAHASIVRGNAQAYQLIHREHADLAGALIGAYYLLRTGEAGECLPLLEELSNNFAETPDATIAFASALLQHGALPQRARSLFLRAAWLDVPFYREGLKRLRAGLDFFYTLSEGEDREARHAIERIRPYQLALHYDNAVTSWTSKPDSLEPLVAAPSRVGVAGGPPQRSASVARARVTRCHSRP
jgi:hypothetical protein